MRAAAARPYGRRMVRLQTRIHVDGISGREIYEFLAAPTDEAYQQWWPGTHLQLHPLGQTADHVGDAVYMDEYVGRRRVRMSAIVREADPGRRLVLQLKKVVALPATLSLEFADEDGGVAITHTIAAGSEGAGRVLDPLLRLIFTRRFASDLDEHVRTEFPLLRDRLPAIRAGQSPKTRRALPSR
jgi:hypothetical protein